MVCLELASRHIRRGNAGFTMESCPCYRPTVSSLICYIPAAAADQQQTQHSWQNRSRHLFAECGEQQLSDTHNIVSFLAVPGRRSFWTDVWPDVPQYATIWHDEKRLTHTQKPTSNHSCTEPNRKSGYKIKKTTERTLMCFFLMSRPFGFVYGSGFALIFVALSYALLQTNCFNYNHQAYDF